MLADMLVAVAILTVEVIGTAELERGAVLDRRISCKCVDRAQDKNPAASFRQAAAARDDPRKHERSAGDLDLDVPVQGDPGGNRRTADAFGRRDPIGHREVVPRGALADRGRRLLGLFCHEQFIPSCGGEYFFPADAG
jgi:hypothetical protein